MSMDLTPGRPACQDDAVTRRWRGHMYDKRVMRSDGLDSGYALCLL